MTPVQVKIRKTSHYISIILNIAKVFMIVAAILSTLGLGTVLYNRLELMKFFVGVGEAPDARVAAVMLPLMLSLLIVTIVVDTAGCHQLYRVFKDISQEGTPFAQKHVRRIKTVAWLTLPTSVLSGTLPNVQRALETGEAKMMISIEAMWIVFGAIIYCLSLIFDYGCQLQRESDETL